MPRGKTRDCELQFQGRAGTRYRTETTAEFGGWTTLTHFTAGFEPFSLTDAAVIGQTQRFYRAAAE
jgi:hypothetical protein